MNCYFHNDVAGVTNCPSCGSALCRSCTDTSPVILDNKKLCCKCAKESLEEQLQKIRSQYFWAKIIVPINALLIYFLISVFLYSSPDVAIIPIWIIGGITGLPSSLSFFFSPDERTVDGIIIRIKEEKGILESCLVPLLFGFLFAPVFVLISLFRNSFLLYNGKSNIRLLEKQLASVKHFLADT